MLELEIRRPSSLLSVELKREITEEQLAQIKAVLDNPRELTKRERAAALLSDIDIDGILNGGLE